MHFELPCSVARYVYVLILSTSLRLIVTSVFALNDSAVSCISNYAELKQALFEIGTGNMERLLYAFTPPNLPLPHFLWVYYFHNLSSQWTDILACPSYNVLHRCPSVNKASAFEEQGSSNANEDESQYHVIFWADSPMLVNLDLPLLKALSYNSALQYLRSGSCVELVIPPFCQTVDRAAEEMMLKFATSFVSFPHAHAVVNVHISFDCLLFCYIVAVLRYIEG